MPVLDTVVLGAIIAVFCMFAVALGSVTWYCSEKRKQPVQHTGRRDYRYPTDAGVIIDD